MQFSQLTGDHSRTTWNRFINYIDEIRSSIYAYTTCAFYSTHACWRLFHNHLNERRVHSLPSLVIWLFNQCLIYSLISAPLRLWQKKNYYRLTKTQPAYGRNLRHWIREDLSHSPRKFPNPYLPLHRGAIAHTITRVRAGQNLFFMCFGGQDKDGENSIIVEECRKWTHGNTIWYMESYKQRCSHSPLPYHGIRGQVEDGKVAM